MKKFTLTILSASFLITGAIYGQTTVNVADITTITTGNEIGLQNNGGDLVISSHDKVLDYHGSGKLFRRYGGAARNGDGGANGAFAPQGDWSNDFVISEKAGTDDIYGGGARMSHEGHGAIGWGSFAAGAYSRAAGPGAVAIGFQAVAGSVTNADLGDPNSIGTFGGMTAFGLRTLATGHASTAMGQETTASGANTFAIGYGTTATAQGGTAIGMHNTTEDALFVIGNGANAASKSDAFVVNMDGSAVFSGDVTVNSDMRLKANITSLGSTIAKLLLIDGKSYVMKTDESKQKIGLLAQDVQAVYPELVKEANNEEGTLSVNYQGLIPVLINAIKEQQAEIDELKKLIKKD